MRSFFRVMISLLLVLFSLLPAPRVQAATLNTIGDRVFGQPDFTSSASGVSDHALSSAAGVALDLSGNLYVADTLNNRVLVFNAPLSSGENAAVVLGQPDFTSNTAN